MKAGQFALSNKFLLPDGKASMIILAHLVDVNRSVVRSNKTCFLFELFCENTEKKVQSEVRRPVFADLFILGPSDRPWYSCVSGLTT